MKNICRFILFVILAGMALTLVSCSHTHEFGGWKTVVEKSCETDGLRRRSCSCGETEEEVIAASHTMTDWKILEYPTCSGTGIRARGCNKCGEEIDRETIPALEHSVSSYSTYNNDAGLTKDGTVSGWCSGCRKTVSKPLVGSSALFAAAFEGKTVSILGDSISTYLNISNGDAADTTNSTIRDGVLYYDAQKIEYMGVKLKDTWWQRTADMLGASVLVNNSWSGSYVKDTSTNTLPTAGAYLDRAVNLHDNTGDNAGEEPDIIFVYMGTNDYYKYKSSCGSLDADDYAEIGSRLDGYTPASVAEAYAIMLHKMRAEYENAEIYCLNVLESPSTDDQLSVFNGMIKDVSQHYGAIYVDICGRSGLEYNSTYEEYVPSDDGDGTKNTLHPNSAGMALISDYLYKVICSESKYYPDMSTLMSE